MKKLLKVYSDGGSRGNPGPSACAYIFIFGGKILHKESKFLGNKTNNEAEYYGLIIALEWLKKNLDKFNKIDSINFYLDSELVVKQIKGIYKVKGNNLKPLYTKVKNLVNSLRFKISFISIPREKNKIADKLLNVEMDENLG
jgi:ribonuclease HI